MTTNEVKVASSMSNMEYRSIGDIARITGLSTSQVIRIMSSLKVRGLIESRMQGFRTLYRLK